MEIPLDFHRFCQIGTRKLLVIIVMTGIASLVWLVQFLSIPYGSTSNIPSGEDYLSNSKVFLSISSNSAGPSSEMKNTARSHFAGNTNGPNDSEGKQGSMDDNYGQSGEISLDKVEKENSLILEAAESKDSGSIVVTNLSISVVSQYNVSATSILSKDNMTETSYSILENNRPEITGSNDNLNMTTNTQLKDGSPGQATSVIQVEMAHTTLTSVSHMNLLLIKSRSSSHSTVPNWPSERDREIVSARSLIENAPISKKDKQLYGSLFHNISIFKRSYEQMEKTLKVYVYKEGAQPVFHAPETKGIYASEGWFMKLMEENHQFKVTDPTRAHLFYFPFSPRQLQKSLYVPNSHSTQNLIAYLKSYLDLISTKYPYWNRTMGADHFLAGCHDWTPRETKKYMGNCIRAMCTADIGQDFTMGKDVSLPTTNVRSAKDPVRDLGGKPASKRTTLAFFAGSIDHGYVRPLLQKYWGNKDPDIEIHGHMGRSGEERTKYVEYMKKSKYCICAKGYEVNTPRVVEAIFYECVPVIISDNFVPPFLEILNWESFAVFVAEKDIPNLKNILRMISEEKYVKMQMRVKHVQRHFLWHTKPVKYDIFHMILHSIWYNRVFQIRVAKGIED